MSNKVRKYLPIREEFAKCVMIMEQFMFRRGKGVLADIGPQDQYQKKKTPENLAPFNLEVL